MKTKYKYVYFELLQQMPKTQRWVIVNNRSKAWLGFIEWYSPWREYCFRAEDNVIFNKDCLADIIDFIIQLKKV